MANHLGTFMQGDTVYLESTEVTKYDPTAGTSSSLTSVTSQKFRVRINGGTGTDVTGSQRGSTNNWYGEYVCTDAGDAEFYSEIVESGKTSHSLIAKFTITPSF